MSITLEIDGLGARRVDTSLGTADHIPLARAVQVLNATRNTFSVPNDNVSRALDLAGIAAVRALVLRPPAATALSVSINGSTFWAIDTLLVALSSAGLITSANVKQAGGAAISVDALVAGDAPPSTGVNGVTIEVDGVGARRADTFNQNSRPIPVKASVTITQCVRYNFSLAASGISTLDFGGISSAKVVILRPAGALTMSVNATGYFPVDLLFIAVNTGAGITGVTLQQATGAAFNVEVLVAG